MYWMLLPPSANAGRHIEDYNLTLHGHWADMVRIPWRTVMNLLSPNR